MSRNGSIIKHAPLQVYVSALMFSPIHSEIRKLYFHDLPKWIRKPPVVADDWSTQVRVLEGGSFVSCVAFSPSDKLIVLGCASGQVIVWDVASGMLTTVLEGLANDVCAVSFQSDGHTVTALSMKLEVRSWETSSGALLRTTQLDGSGLNIPSTPARCAAFSSDGTLIAIGCRTSGIVWLWDAKEGSLWTTCKGHLDIVTCVAFLTSGKSIASGSWDETVRIWSTATGDVQTILNNHSPVAKIAIS